MWYTKINFGWYTKKFGDSQMIHENFSMWYAWYTKIILVIHTKWMSVRKVQPWTAAGSSRASLKNSPRGGCPAQRLENWRWLEKGPGKKADVSPAVQTPVRNQKVANVRHCHSLSPSLPAWAQFGLYGRGSQSPSRTQTTELKNTQAQFTSKLSHRCSCCDR